MEDRKRIEAWVHKSVCDLETGIIAHMAHKIETAGELNYVITRIIHECLNNWGKNYQSMNDIVGALDNAKDEFRRRIQHPYENEKIYTNGDIMNNTHPSSKSK